MAKTKKLTGRKRDERITAYMFVAPAWISDCAHGKSCSTT